MSVLLHRQLMSFRSLRDENSGNTWGEVWYTECPPIGLYKHMAKLSGVDSIPIG